MIITSLQNDRVKDLVRLRERRHRDRTGRFIIEGYREITRAVDAGVAIEAVHVCRDLFLGPGEQPLIDRITSRGGELVELAEGPFRKVSYRDRPEGLLAVAPQFSVELGSLHAGPEPLIVVAEAIEKPGNLGTMLRTADAVGADAVIVSDPTTDPFNPNVVRASTGTLFTVSLAVASSEDTVNWLRASKVTIVATTPDATTLHWEADLRGAVAVVVGAEQYGLSDMWLQAADVRVRIPMEGVADSLNAAMAAGVVLYECLRQRLVSEARSPGSRPNADTIDT